MVQDMGALVDLRGDLIPLDVGVGANGDTWIIDDSYNDTVYKWLNGGGWQLSGIEHASRLSVGPAGDPWVVDSQKRGAGCGPRPRPTSAWDLRR